MSKPAVSQEQAISELGQIEVLIEMFGICLIQEPWKTVDRKRIEKMENAFYLLQEQFALKRQKIREAYAGGGLCE